MLTADEPGLSGVVHLSRPAYKVERTLRVNHSLNYRYPQSVRDVTTRLRLQPPDRRGSQCLAGFDLKIAPLPTIASPSTDRFGNTVLEVKHANVWQNLTVIVDMEIETEALHGPNERVLPQFFPASLNLPEEGTELFLQSTPLTQPDAELSSLAQGTAAQQSDTCDLAFALCQAVYRHMEYRSGSTTVKTTAVDAWQQRAGVCQDFAHILLALCRQCALPARYVSGFLPGEGAMHAWVEVLVPLPEGAQVSGVLPTGHNEMDRTHGWVALDPTHDRWVGDRYVTIAVGRDYADISPTSGTYVGGGPGALTHRSKVQIQKTTQTPL